MPPSANLMVSMLCPHRVSPLERVRSPRLSQLTRQGVGGFSTFSLLRYSFARVIRRVCPAVFSTIEQAMLKEIKIASIKVGNRHRKDMGDLTTLAESILQEGLLQPIGVTDRLELVFGERRIR